jgi:hypothetical protein
MRQRVRWLGLGLALVVLAACSEGAETLEGRVQRVVVDRPERGESALELLLRVGASGDDDSDDPHAEEIVLAAREGDQSTVELRGLVELGDLATGVKVRATGAFAASAPGERRRFVVDGFEAEAPAHESHAAALIVDPTNPPAARKLAVILFNFQNDDRQPLSVDEARRKIFTDPNSVRAFHQEQSYGFIDLGGKLDKVNGDVFGWYTLPANNRPCAESKWDDMALAMAAEKGIDTTGYDHYVFIFPYTEACLYGGRGEQPGKNTWINGGSIRTMNHELGHNFGTPHASSYTCTNAAGDRVAISPTCRTTEYGNPFDVMGHGYRHTNAFNKARARWLGSKNIIDVGQSGVYTLLPQEQPSNGVQLLSIVATETSSYYIEYRQPFGYDDFAADAPAATGLIILYGGGLRTLTNSYLLDMNPGTASFADAPLGVGKTFVAAGVKVTLVERTPQAAQVRIELSDAGGGSGPPDGGVEGGARDSGDGGALEVGTPGTGENAGTGGAGGAASSGGAAGQAARGSGGAVGPGAPTAGSDANDDGSCGCRIGGRATAPTAAWLLPALVLALVARRRGRGTDARGPATGARPCTKATAWLALLLLGHGGCAEEATMRGQPTPMNAAGAGGNGRGGNGGARAGQGSGGVAGRGSGGSASSAGNTGIAGTTAMSNPDAPMATDSASGDLRGSDAADTGDGGLGPTFTVSAAPPDVAAACARHAEVYCRRLDECMPNGVRRNFGELPFCLARRDQACRVDLLTPGRTESPARRLSCADAVDRQSCRDFMFSRPLAACDYPAGTVKQGGGCHRSSMCAAGLACEVETDEQCGTCQPALAVGGDCSFWSGGCPQGTLCYADQCLMPLTLAAACKRTAAACLGGMICTDAGCVEKSGDVGADCARNDVCDPLKSLFCDLASGKCAALPVPVEVGKPCGVVDASGAASRCEETAACFAPPASPTRRVCVARLPAGSKCDTATGPLCTPPAECTRGVCVVPRIVMAGPPTYVRCP